MSCRTTSSGSLAISYITRHYKLKDEQCTSLYHGLKNEAQTFGHTVDEENYYDVVRYIKRRIQRDPTGVWTPRRQQNAVAKAEEVLAADMPDSEHAYAFINIADAASLARTSLANMYERYSDIYGMSTSDVEAEFSRLYEEGVGIPSGTIRNHYRAVPRPLPQDKATRYAAGVLAAGMNCDICGQFTSSITVANHTCPMVGRRNCARCGERTRGLGNHHVCPSTRGRNPDRSMPLADWEQELLAEDSNNITATERRLRSLFEANNLSQENPVRPVRPRRHVEPVVPVIPPQPLPVSWVEDMSAFQRTYDKVRAHVPPGTPVLPTFPDLERTPGGITGGLGLPGTGNTFGLELEFDFPDEEEPYMLRNEFASALYDENISLTQQVMRWHYIGDEGAGRPGGSFSQTAYGWSIESDRSVDGLDGARGLEIKSQILYDEPDTWRNLRRICEIATALGGKATPRCGLHVNVGAVGYPAGNPANHTRLLKLAAAYDDTLIRLAHNPAAGPTHRGRRYCNPVDLPPEGFSSVQMAKGWSNHYQAFNLNNVPDERSRRTSTSRIEVRLFDASLDVGRIQAQVALSLGLVSAARNEIEPLQNAEFSGTHRSIYGARNLDGDRWAASTSSFRQLVDILGTQGLNKPEHREMFMGLFTSTKWQGGSN